MLPLIQKEFVQTKSQLFQVLGIIVIAALIFGRAQPSMAFAYLTIFPIVLSVTLPQVSFQNEERANTLAFLRTLPISSEAIVGAKYAFLAMIIVAYQAVFWLFTNFYLSNLTTQPLVTISVSFASACLLGSISLLLHFWLGLKRARTALMVGLAVIGLPLIALETSGNVTKLLGGRTEGFVDVATSATGFLMAIALGGALMLASWSLSSRIFARRDLSQMP